jgi:hypothetical protein
MDAWVIILIVLIFVIIYAMYMITSTAALVKSMSPLKTPITIPATDATTGKVMIPSPTSQNYYYEAWVYLTSAVTETTAIADGTAITTLSNVSNIVSRFHSSKKDVGLAVFTDKQTGKYTLCVLAGTTASVVPYFVTEDLPINKWVYLVMNVSGKLIEVYVNGKLLRTIYLATTDARSAESSITIGSTSMTGYITRAIRKPENIDPKKVWDQYLQGNGQYGGALYGLLDYINSYAFKMDITKDGKIRREFKAQLGSADTK